MKLPELKERLKNKYTVRIIAGVLVIALAGGSFGAYTVMADSNSTNETAEATSAEADDVDLNGILDKVSVSADKADKEESVYIIADANGNPTKTIVVDHLTNKDQAATITDVSSLKDIENVKGDETFTQDGDKLTWNAEGKDIYYNGTTTEQVPVTQSVKYYLDGQEIKPEDLAGKSGKVTIRFDYKNNTSYTETVNGEEYTVNVPFVAVTALSLDDSFSNVEVTNGKLEEKEGKNIVLGYALPGLKDSLAIEDGQLKDVEIPEYFEVTADVENFELKTAMTFVVNGTSFVDSEGSLFSGDVDSTINKLTDAIGQLTDGSGKLADGAGQLDEGLNTLKTSLKDFSSGITTLKTGIDTYLDGTQQVNDGLTKLKKGTGTLAEGAKTINSSAKSISDGITKLDKALTTKLTDAEKAAYEKKAKAAAKKAVEDKFAAEVAPGVSLEAYIGNTAATSLTDSLTSDESNATVAAGITTGVNNLKPYIEAGIKAQYIATATASIKAKYSAQITGLMTSQGMTEEQAISAIFAQGHDGVALDTYATSYATTAATNAIAQVAEGTASALTESIAEAAAPKVGASVSSTVKSAAIDAAEAAAANATVTSIDSTKESIASQIEAKQDNGYSLVTGAKALSEGTGTLVNSLPELTTGIDKLVNGSNKLVANNNKISAGVKKLADGTAKVVEGVDKLANGSGELSEGANKLADGILEFDEKGIDKLVNAYEGDLKPLADRLQVILNAGSSYQSFTGIADGNKGTVKFIYKLAAIEATDVE